MIKIIDTYSKINTLFDGAEFNLDRWEDYINSIYEDSARLFKDEVEEYTADGKYTFEKDFLPIINNVCNNPKMEILHRSFIRVTKNLDGRIKEKFGRELNCDIVLYLGLCNAAGWVTNINGRDTVMLGVEKIIELEWQDIDSMYGLIYHELGHIYHAQYGTLEQTSEESGKEFVWQLFTEGIAMYFEQRLVGNLDYYHQDKDGWKNWCGENIARIAADFDADLSSMSQFDQRYFGDWVSYCGYGDVGYYLGARFVHRLLEKYSLDDIITFDIDKAYSLYKEFVRLYIG